MTDSVTVWIPPGLRARTAHRVTVRVAAGTIREVIDDLERVYPGLRFNLCRENGDLRPYVNIFLEGEEIRGLRGVDTVVSAGAMIHILHSVAGG